MKQIEFRAWHKEGAYMMPVEEIDFENKLINKSGVWRWFNELVLMQYTGLKDKNGVQIFEGDWIRVETQEKDNGEFPIGYVVRANDEPGMFIALPEQLKETGKRQYHLENLYKHYSDEFEVIGNIYENSDLI